MCEPVMDKTITSILHHALDNSWLAIGIFRQEAFATSFLIYYRYSFYRDFIETSIDWESENSSMSSSWSSWFDARC